MKDSSLRMCISYFQLKKVTTKNKDSIPKIDELFDKLQGVICFSKTNLRSSYHQLKVREHDILKITFCTQYGYYEFLIMSFRLTNTPTTFMYIINRAFKSYDNILIYSRSKEKYVNHLRICHDPNWGPGSDGHPKITKA